MPVAVTGLHGRFPGALDPKAYWHNLVRGRDMIRQVPPERWIWQEHFSESEEQPDATYSNCGGFMPFPDRFDHRFFGILPREAQAMDPQQRVFLQTVWAALEDAGYAPAQLTGRKVGVFVGVGHADYPVLMRRDNVASDAYRGTGIALTAIANRVSFTFDFHGPSESIDTACSSSLVAVHRATQALRDGECDLAIAGGVNLLLGPELFIAFAKAGMLSRSGRCRTFDASADGYVRGEGVAALVLSPLAEAERNGDYIYGVIRGSAENHGGRAHSFTAPNVKAQAEVVSEAWQRAGFSLRQAGLIETHGTGTPLGDPIEVNGLKKALARSATEFDSAPDRIALGASKSHIGHLEAAAGIASLIKALLSMQHRRIPGNLHHQDLNPHIQLQDTPLFVPTDAVPWGGEAADMGDHSPLLAGVSSFGFGGVNAHVVLQSHTVPSISITGKTTTGDEVSDATPHAYLVLLSAKDNQGLDTRVRQLVTFLEEDEKEALRIDQKSLLQGMRNALDLPSQASAEAPANLADLGLSASQFTEILNRIAQPLGLKADLTTLHGCITLEEVANRLVQQRNPIRQQDDTAAHRLICRTALASSAIRLASLAQITRSLLEGRDFMSERLALVAGNKGELLEQLRGYLQDPAAEDAPWVQATVRAAKYTSAQRPEPQKKWPDRAALLKWARYWVTTKAAVLQWDELYPGEPLPAKIPLPAYPFRLDRVWYEATPERKTLNHHGTSQRPSTAWDQCWSGPAPLPASIAALGSMIEHLLSRTAVQRLHLADVEFGPPIILTPDQEIMHRQTATARGETVQGLISEPCDRVLLQTCRLTERADPVPGDTPAPLDMQSISGDAYYQQLTRLGLDFSTSCRYVESVEFSPNRLDAQLSLPRQGPGDIRFWAAFTSTVLSGLAHLLSMNNRIDGPVAPFRLDRLTVDAVAASSLRRIVVNWDDRAGLASVRAFGVDKKPAISLDGLAARPTPPSRSVQPSRRTAT